MTKTNLKFSGKKLIAAAFLSASVLLTSFTTNAAIYNTNIELVSGEKSNIALTANTNDALLFKLNVNNEKGDRFTVTIKNEAGDLLFSRAFSDVNFDKQFKLLKGEQTNSRYYISIISDNKVLEDSYVVSSTVRTINDVAVNKL
ncbi:hypothetical protein [Parafilimonas terrae]|uniref:Por secretion system C-terminal sorting domain-containing protein n=1 Tax=Parafilimonas terrae TaxID=1465490 RepID=A0A1I5YUV7_9BACT|nr:hypothetical protein [Parafilimonas terrae]SFQ48053.1 hypothetical protein SAMN05444277_11460 [Parafilimonas terrae]